jgi:RHH-type proline utilization regulon transcriptional repressor/proline dehydrogenase/delta 1-pyrroline-5-carboxylate dehydrogenase
VPGETNAVSLSARGIGAVIAPWNFPLAIPCGMTTAALVTGNAVLLKPAEQTPGVALRLVEILLEAGLPPGALAYLPAWARRWARISARIRRFAFVVFTGSKDVGLGLVEAAARHQPGQRHVRRVIAEMGGKNAIIVDADADLDVAVPAS